jgi:hypothetical protein
MINRAKHLIGKKQALKDELTKRKMGDYEHRNCLNQMIKAIWVAPLHTDVKMVMTLRIWGSTPKFFYPLTIQQVARKLLEHEPSHAEVEAFKQLEAFGVLQMEEFLKNVSPQEMVNMFNEQYRRNMGHMFSTEKFGRKDFKV